MKNTITFTVLGGLLGLALLLWGCSEEYDSVSSKTPQLIFDEIDAEHPVWSPLGDTIVFSGGNGYGGDLWTIDPQGGNLSLLLTCEEVDPPAYALYPYDYSDDGYLLFTGGLYEVYYLLPGGKEPVYLFPGSYPTVEGSLNGNYNIAYLIPEKDGIYLSDIHGSEPQLVVEGDFIYGIDWSPDGTMLTYIRGIHLGQSDWDYELCVYDFTTQSEQVIYDTGYAPKCPRWSPDGTLIAFADQYYPEPGYDYPMHRVVWIIPSEGGEPKRITNFPYGPIDSPGVSWLSWSPDGKWIVYDLITSELWKVYVD